MHSVGVSRYKAPPAEDCDFLLDRLCRWLNSDTFSPREGMMIVYAVIKAVSGSSLLGVDSSLWRRKRPDRSAR